MSNSIGGAAPRGTANPAVSLRGVSFSYPEGDPVVRDLSVDIPTGITGLVGPNGIGKSTVLLLAGARLFSAEGSVEILGEDAEQFLAASGDPAIEERRNRIASVVYQNMEFETEEPVGEILRYVDGTREGARILADPLQTIVAALELTDDLDKRMQELSKGASQRTIIALSLLYGAPLLLMDEPVFAVEPSRADRVFAYLSEYARRADVSIVYSAHDVEFTRSHSDNALLFYADESGGTENVSPDSRGTFPRVEIGPVAGTLTRDKLEKAYRAPFDTLKQRENLYREVLKGM